MSDSPILDYKGPFNLRVYGICITNKHVLVCDEIFMGKAMTKFPGGGLEYGEGTIDCLKREFKEEFDLEIEVGNHFYTTDYFQKAQYFKKTQLISIYYRINILKPKKIPLSNQPIVADKNSPQNLRFAPLDLINQKDLTFPIDQKVIAMLKSKA
ncbi:MAG TPA: NUDIX domain-containing protein [Marinilabiliaceae bacterium]|nr:NUDIX domain-containing protein [Marinilabiliaceae bacterium]